MSIDCAFFFELFLDEMIQLAMDKICMVFFVDGMIMYH